VPDANGAKTLRVDGERLSVADCVGCRTRVDDDVISAPRQRLRHQWRHQRVWCHQCQQLHCHSSRPPPLAACTMMTETAIIRCFYTLASIWRHHLVLHCMVLHGPVLSRPTFRSNPETSTRSSTCQVNRSATSPRPTTTFSWRLSADKLWVEVIRQRRYGPGR